MKLISLVPTLLLAMLAVCGGDAAKCTLKPSTAPAPAATKAPAPVAPSNPAPAPAPARTPAPAPVPAPATNSSTAAPPASADGDAKRSAGCGQPAKIATGTFTTTVNGKQRQYMVRVPQNYDSSKAYRLIFTFHWRGGSMQNAATVIGGYYGLESLSKESTIFVSPQGLNAGWANAGGEDIAFVDALVKATDEGLCVNQNLRFATGFSYGAMMSHSVACSRPDVFRGVAVLAGADFSGCQGGTKPIAYYIQHGLSDNVLPISGGRGLRDRFLKNNGCTAQTAQEPTVNSGTHIKTEYKGCSAGHPVTWVAFDGGHVTDPADRGQRASWTPDEVWKFFSQFS